MPLAPRGRTQGGAHELAHSEPGAGARRAAAALYVMIGEPRGAGHGESLLAERDAEAGTTYAERAAFLHAEAFGAAAPPPPAAPQGAA